MKDVQQKQCSAGVQTVFTMSLKRSQFFSKEFYRQSNYCKAWR